MMTYRKKTLDKKLACRFSSEGKMYVCRAFDLLTSCKDL